jgi:hypothetical protein
MNDEMNEDKLLFLIYLESIILKNLRLRESSISNIMKQKLLKSNLIISVF